MARKDDEIKSLNDEVISMNVEGANAEELDDQLLESVAGGNEPENQCVDYSCGTMGCGTHGCSSFGSEFGDPDEIGG